MIDFRYHIVSLISVFLALAVGIVLGAGPLRDYIADELSGQVDQLREEKDVLRTELDSAQAALQDRSTFLTEAAPQLFNGALDGRTVAIVELPGSDPDVSGAVQARLDQAGATVTGTIAVTEAWLDPAEVAFRSGIAENVVSSMNPAPGDAASGDLVLAQALGQALTLRDPENPQQQSNEAEQILELLRSSELIGEGAAVDGPAYATVVIAPQAPTDPLTDAQVEELTAVNDASITLAEGLAETGEGSLIAGTDGGAGTLLTALRANSEAADRVTSVDAVGTITGQVTVPLALAAEIADDGGHFGLSESANAVVPDRHELPAPAPAEFAPGPVETDG
ncbi:copper transporter [Ruania alba]|uniref:Copper transport outer membrane protein, MctB n=1 Tax=Ruania alba TaxID=648782 RepID=A0A1H5EHM5_9MICO|nr:copper transporter [Ruania alba]SED90540.1 Copper transport outer membrane protein, MctB [Ruania alba]